MKDKNRFFVLLYSVFFVFAYLTHPTSALSIEFGYPALTGSVEHISPGDVNEANARARVAITSTLIGAALPVSLTENSNLEVNLSGGFFNFDWTDKQRLKFSNGQQPWDNLYSAEFSLSYIYKWNTSWSSFLGSGIGAGWEEETDDMFSYRGFLGTTYRFGADWRATLGFGIGRGPEKTSGGLFRGPEGSTLGPFANIAYNRSRRHQFQPGWSFFLAFPPEAEIAYVINSRWAVHFNWGEFGGIFRLSDNNNVSPDGLLAASFSKVGLGVDFRPVNSLTLSLGVSEYFNKQLEIQNKNGKTLQTIGIYDSLGGLFTVNWAF
jgi:hypothetical protein